MVVCVLCKDEAPVRFRLGPRILFMKKYLLGVAVVMGAVAVFLLMGKPAEQPKTDLLPSGADPGNTTYLIDGEPILLTGGVHEKAAAPDSSSTVKTAIFSQPVIGDLNHDGHQDMALVLRQDMGGSGLFYYVAVALQNPDATAQGLNALFVGDRIAPQTLEIKDNVVIFNYAKRKSDEPMTAQPSVGVSFYAVVENGVLVPQKAGE